MTFLNKDKSNQADSDVKDMSLFRDNKFCLFVYKKTGRLSAGVYVVTNLLSDNEPLKWELRKYAQKLVAAATDEKLFAVASERVAVTSLHTSSLAVLSMLEVAHFANLISQMNFTILKAEFLSFIICLEEKLAGISEISGVLDANFFELSREYRMSSQDLEKGREVRKASQSPFIHKGQSIGHRKDMSLKNQSDLQKLGVNSGINKGQNHAFESRNQQKESRRNVILNLFKSGESLIVKDISNNIKDCSEKTVQRELLGLVALGVLKKEGERRWSRYSLGNTKS